MIPPPPSVFELHNSTLDIIRNNLKVGREIRVVLSKEVFFGSGGVDGKIIVRAASEPMRVSKLDMAIFEHVITTWKDEKGQVCSQVSTFLDHQATVASNFDVDAKGIVPIDFAFEDLLRDLPNSTYFEQRSTSMSIRVGYMILARASLADDPDRYVLADSGELLVCNDAKESLWDEQLSFGDLSIRSSLDKARYPQGENVCLNLWGVPANVSVQCRLHRYVNFKGTEKSHEVSQVLDTKEMVGEGKVNLEIPQGFPESLSLGSVTVDYWIEVCIGEVTQRLPVIVRTGVFETTVKPYPNNGRFANYLPIIHDPIRILTSRRNYCRGNSFPVSVEFSPALYALGGSILCMVDFCEYKYTEHNSLGIMKMSELTSGNKLDFPLFLNLNWPTSKEASTEGRQEFTRCKITVTITDQFLRTVAEASELIFLHPFDWSFGSCCLG